MFPKLFPIPLTLAQDYFWPLLIIGIIGSALFYYLLSKTRNEAIAKAKKAGASLAAEKIKPGWVFYVYNVLFYIFVLILIYTIASQIIPQRGDEPATLDLNTYGFMLAIAFIVGIYLVIRKARSLKLPEERYLDLSIWMIVSSLFGARLFFMLFEYSTSESAPPLAFFQDPLTFFTRITDGGLVAYGGMITAVAVSLYLIHRYGLPFGKTFDIFAPSIALGVAFARLGCNFAGCCFGALTDPANPLSVNWDAYFFDIAPVFNHYHGIASSFCQTNVDAPGDLFHYVWPTQLMSSFNGLMIFAFLTVLYIKRKKINWVVFGGIAIFVVEAVVILISKSYETVEWLNFYSQLPGKVIGEFGPDTWILGLAPYEFLLVSIMGILLIGLSLIVYWKKLRFDGIVFVFLMASYSTTRILIESVRNDTERFLELFTAAQWTGMVIMLVAWLAVLYYAFIKKSNEELPDSANG